MFMNRKFDAYVLWPLTKSVQNWIVNQSTASNFMVCESCTVAVLGKLSHLGSIENVCNFNKVSCSCQSMNHVIYLKLRQKWLLFHADLLSRLTFFHSNWSGWIKLSFWVKIVVIFDICSAFNNLVIFVSAWDIQRVPALHGFWDLKKTVLVRL